MNPEELGLLILKMQDDDVLAGDVRRFLKELMTDEEVRRNAKLVASLSGLPEEVRRKHCLANIMVLLTSPSLAPTITPAGWRKTTRLFKDKYFLALTGPWKSHIQSTDTSITTQEFQKRLRSRGTRRAQELPDLSVSSVLAEHIAVVEDFWGVRGTLVL